MLYFVIKSVLRDRLKEARIAFGLSLLEAKQYVDELEARLTD